MKHKPKYYLNRIISISINDLFILLRTKVTSNLIELIKHKRDLRVSSYALSKNKVTSLNYKLNNLPLDFFIENVGWLEEVTDNYLSHYFDLLGSGWTHVFHGVQCRGLEGYQFPPITSIKTSKDGNWLKNLIVESNYPEAHRIWNLIDKDYFPIDWQLDFKSGYRWQEKVWYRHVQFGHLKGVDIKVPWELARMQHLPLLAWAYGHSQQKSMLLHPSDVYLREFRNQVLDFLATNPPRWGVNWVCSMDVSIRMVNWLITYDLFKSFGAEFDKEFETVFFRSVYEHGLHIIENLEWSENERNNHYLSNIIGLLFISNYLPSNSETNAWLAFSIQETILEVKRQFNEDGSNFEFSTSYHRLSSEMVAYATAVILGLSEEKKQSLLSYDHKVIKVKPYLSPAPLPFYPIPTTDITSPIPAWFFSRLERMAELTMDITRQDGHILQIGDNDSGRFVKLFPVFHSFSGKQVKELFLNLFDYDDSKYDKNYWLEDGLDHHHLVACINGLINRSEFSEFVGDYERQESKLIEVFSHSKPITSKNIHMQQEHTNLDVWSNFSKLVASNSESSVNTLTFTTKGNFLNDLNIKSYPNMGLYIFRSAVMLLSVRCGLNNQASNNGHMHNDQLSIELMIDGNNIFRDPGTYIYTPLIEKRNLYRSEKSHFVPQIMNKEISDLSLDAFKNCAKYNSNLIYIGPKGFIGTHNGYGFPVYRQIIIEEKILQVIDISLGDKLSSNNPISIPYSPGYGFLSNAK